MDITQDCLIDHGEHDEEFQEDSTIEDAPDAAQEIELPPCELSKLEEIWNIFTESSIQSTPIRKEKLSVAIENSGYIKKLLDLFHMCEDLDNMEGLHHLYEIFKNIFLLNRNELFEIMFSEETIFDVIGVLEHQPSSPQPSQHRTYLKETAKFKQVVPMTNKELLNKIHQTYRVQYIQDVILPTPSVFEENHLSSLTSFIFFNKVEIVSMIQVSAAIDVIIWHGSPQINMVAIIYSSIHCTRNFCSAHQILGDICKWALAYFKPCSIISKCYHM